MKYVPYGKKEINYLKQKDPILAEIIDRIGHIHRPMDEDLFSSVVHHIVAQQISSKAQATIWRRMLDSLGEISVDTITSMDVDTLQSFGMTYRKAEYILDFTHKVESHQFDLEKVKEMDDQQAIQTLSSLKGIGVWTAEMILLFSLGRKDIFAYDDLAIHKGLRMVYHHRNVSRKQFEKYRRRYSPYGSIASLYLWKVSSGFLPDLKDYAPKKR